MGKVGGHAEKTAGARHRPAAPDVVTAGAPIGDGDGGSVPSAWERLRSRDLAVKVFVAGVTYVALAPFSQLGAIVGVMVSPIVSDLVKDYVERHHWSARRLRRRSAAVAVLGHEEDAYAARRRPGRGPGGGIPGALMASVAAVALVTAAIAAADVHDGIRSGTDPQHHHGQAFESPDRAVGHARVAPTADPSASQPGPVPGTGLPGRSPTKRPAVVTPPPPPPTDLSGPKVTADQPELTWTGVAGADGYTVYRDDHPVSDPAGTAFIDTEATDGSHSYSVTARVGGVESERSNIVRVTYAPRLPAPGGILQTSAITDAPALAWDPVAGASAYDVYRDGGLVAEVQEPGWSDDAAAPGTHTYTVSTVNRIRAEGAPSAPPVPITYDPPPVVN